jgi:hypothetical protein
MADDTVAPARAPIIGSQKNKLVILGVETPGRQGVKSHEYLDITRFYTGTRKGCISSKMVIYF